MYLKKPCVHCGGEATYQRYSHREEFAGVTVTDPRGMAYACAACGEVELSLQQLADLQRSAARVALQDLSVIKGGVLKYARKAAGLRQADLARLLGLTAETISRAETGSDPVSRPVQMAMLGILQLLEAGVSREALLASANQPAPADHVDLVVADPLRAA